MDDGFNYYNDTGYYLNYTRIRQMEGVEDYNLAPRMQFCDLKIKNYGSVGRACLMLIDTELE